MSGLRSGPRAGSRAHTALTGLFRLGGAADLRTWMNACRWSDSINEFQKVIIERLGLLGMVEVKVDTYSVTRRGREHLDIDADAPAPVPPVLVGPRAFFPARELSTKHMIRMPLTREGALDYATIPSRMGDVVKPHLASDGLVRGVKR
jgi:hypothetical protein